MRVARIKNGVVINVEESLIETDELIKSDTADIGDLYIDGQFIKPENQNG